MRKRQRKKNIKNLTSKMKCSKDFSEFVTMFIERVALQVRLPSWMLRGKEL